MANRLFEVQPFVFDDRPESYKRFSANLTVTPFECRPHSAVRPLDSVPQMPVKESQPTGDLTRLTLESAPHAQL